MQESLHIKFENNVTNSINRGTGTRQQSAKPD